MLLFLKSFLFNSLLFVSKNLSSTIVMDVGHSLNPAIDIGQVSQSKAGQTTRFMSAARRLRSDLCVQVEGGFMQGLGLFTLEELHYSPQGVLLTRGPGAYKIPAFGDIPAQLTVSLLRDAPNDKAIFASKVTTTVSAHGVSSVVIAARPQTQCFAFCFLPGCG